MNQRHTARSIVIHQGHVLLMERWRKDENGRMMHYFSIPGGVIEEGETPEVAAVRELHEEMHMLVRPQKRLHQHMHRKGSHTFLLCQYLSGAATLHPGSPESSISSVYNRFTPCWLDKKAFAHAKLHPEYESVRPIIDALL